MYEVRDLSFSYTVGGRSLDVLKNLDFRVREGEFVAIQGPSGSGKSTLFYILGFLLKPSSGKVLFDQTEITQLSGDELTAIRNRRIGFIFQQFHLLSNINVLQNILLPTLYPNEITTRTPQLLAERKAKATALAQQLGLSEHLTHLPNQLSGGQQQRVAIARALIHDVDLILADEPTGNLDSKTAQEIMALLKELNRRGKTIILITHDGEVAKYCSKVYHLKDGSFTHIEENYPQALPSASIANDNATTHAPPLLPSKLSPQIYRRILEATFPLVVENLLRNKVKSLLTMLGVVIGVAAVLAMITLGLFTRSRILETYETLGVNKVLIRGYPNWNLKAVDRVAVNFESFDWEKDLKPLKHVFPEAKYLSPVFRIGQNNVTVGGKTISNKAETFGITPEYLLITNRQIIAGRNISPFHVETRSPVCLIGYDIAQQLFSHTPAIGQMISVTDSWQLSFSCRIIGVLASQTSTKDASPPNMHILIPFTYFQSISPNWWFKRAHEAALQIESGNDVEITGNKIKAYFEQKYGKSGEFNVDSDSALVAQMKKFLTIFAALITAIALISLLVGGIGINNMMLVSVSDRIKEFGIRKALGATDRSIRFQVLLESLCICVLAGFAGVILGFASYEILIYVATRFVPALKFEWVIIPSAMLLSLVSIVAVGVLSGFVPALRAEKLQIIEALRTE